MKETKALIKPELVNASSETLSDAGICGRRQQIILAD